MNHLCRSLSLAAVFSLICTSQVRSSEFSAAEVLQIWNTRAKEVSAIDVTFQVSHVQTFIADTPDPRAEKEDPRLIAYKTTERLMVSDKMMRYEQNGDRPDIETGELRAQNFICSYDSEQSRTLFEPDSNTPYPVGFIADETRCSNAISLNNYPLLLAYAPISLSRTGILDLEAMTIKSENAKIGDRECLVVSQPQNNDTSKPTYELWLDPNAEFSIRRLRAFNFGYCITQFDCEYAREADHWLPSKWTFTLFSGDGVALLSTTSTVSQQRLKQSLTREDFSITFPVGTVVSDSRNPETAGRGGTHDYIVLENGKKRVITWEEFDASYEDLLATEPVK